MLSAWPSYSACLSPYSSSCVWVFGPLLPEESKSRAMRQIALDCADLLPFALNCSGCQVPQNETVVSNREKCDEFLILSRPYICLARRAKTMPSFLACVLRRASHGGKRRAKRWHGDCSSCVREEQQSCQLERLYHTARRARSVPSD